MKERIKTKCCNVLACFLLLQELQNPKNELFPVDPQNMQSRIFEKPS